MSHNNYYISKDEIFIIRCAFGDSGSYGSRFGARCIVHNTYTFPRRGNKENSTPIQGPVLKITKHLLNKIFLPRYSPDIG